MYANPRKNKNDSFFLKLVVGIALILVVLLCVFALSGLFRKKDSGNTPPTTDPSSHTTDHNPTQEPGESQTSALTTTDTGAPTTQEPPVSDTNTSTPSGTEPSGNPQLSETADRGQAYIDQMIFLGDSTTYGLKAYGVLSGGKQTKQVWTPSSGTLTLSYASTATIVYPETGEELTIQTAAEQKKPEYLVITLGVNGVSFMDETYFKNEYIKMVKSIQSVSPNTKIIINSIYPVASNYQHISSINNEKITRANTWLLDVAEECGVKYLDTYSCLVDQTGFLNSSYQNGDGLHLNPTGFNIVLNNLRTHGYPAEA